MLNSLRKNLANLISPQKNSMSLPLQFLKHGNRAMHPDWTEVIMDDRDHYVGYGYAAIRNRSSAVARTAIENLRTESSREDFDHPYLEILDNSRTFTNYQFWSDISTFLDLEGWYFLMAVRAVADSRVGTIQEFKLLNPYNIRRIMSGDTLEVGGYVETRKGFVREIPKEMIIEIKELNPFDEDKPYAITDAAKESQFTLKTAGDYTRHALKHNINAPGIMSTDVQLEEEEFKNFISRVKNHSKGEPIFGNGQGAITWENMQTELTKAALREVSEVSRDSLFAVSGVSKTIMGIEQSGTTRETARVQKELSMEGHILPRIQTIIDAINQDYRNNYEREYSSNRAELVVDNPMIVDFESDLKENEVKQKRFELYQSLINAGVEASLAAQYVKGEIDIDMMPLEPAPTITVENQFEKERSGLIQQQQGALQNAITNIEQQLVSQAITRLNKKNNQIEDESELVTQTEKKEAARDLAVVLLAFYGIIVNFKGKEVMRDRVSEFGLMGDFTLTQAINREIKKLSKKVSVDHIDTVAQDIFRAARDASLRGDSQTEIISSVRKKYAETISEARAKTIARTETNRAFTKAQFEADKQFVEQNELEGRVFKQWRTRSDNPCPFCLALEAEGRIPFNKNFRNLGDTIEVGRGRDKKVLEISYTSLEAGNAHPNCSCVYELIIENE